MAAATAAASAAIPALCLVGTAGGTLGRQPASFPTINLMMILDLRWKGGQLPP